MKDEKLTFDEASDRLGIPIHTLRQAAKTGELKVIRYNQRVIRVTIDALKEYENSRTLHNLQQVQ